MEKMSKWGGKYFCNEAYRSSQDAHGVALPGEEDDISSIEFVDDFLFELLNTFLFIHILAWFLVCLSIRVLHIVGE